jgi:hypothetical protein
LGAFSNMDRAEDLFNRIVAGGETAIDELIASRQSEELFLDFKRSSDNGSGRRLSDVDRKNLAKSISGFGNSEGGVVVWGIDCSRNADGADVASLKVPLSDARRFVSWLEGSVSGSTVPPHSRVRSAPVARLGSEEGFAVTYIPKSNEAPHQMVGKLQYYIRAGSGFAPTPHGVLAGMFGRRPPPHVFHVFLVERASVEGNTISFSICLMLRNQEPSIATDLFATISFTATPGPGSKIGFELAAGGEWTGYYTFGTHIACISKPTVRLPPEAHLQCVILRVNLTPPFQAGIRAKAVVGAGNSPPYRFELKADKDEVESLCGKFISSARSGTLSDDERREFPGLVLGLPRESIEREEAEKGDP